MTDLTRYHREIWLAKPSHSLVKLLQLNERENNPLGFVSPNHISQGELVKFWQYQLKCWALTIPDLHRRFFFMLVTDSYKSNPEFDSLVKEFQRRHGLHVDGIIGPRMFRKFFENYFFNPTNPAQNLGKAGFEQFAFRLMDEQDFKKVLEPPPIELLNRYRVRGPLPKGYSAQEILANRKLFKKFEEIINEVTQGEETVPARQLLLLCKNFGVDPTLVLAQGILESRWGTQGAGKATKNIFNVGNTDDGTLRYFSTYAEGLEEYLKLLRNRYHVKAERFIEGRAQRRDGKGRYATDPDYTDKLRQVVHKIRQHLSKP